MTVLCAVAVLACCLPAHGQHRHPRHSHNHHHNHHHHSGYRLSECDRQVIRSHAVRYRAPHSVFARSRHASPTQNVFRSSRHYQRKLASCGDGYIVRTVVHDPRRQCHTGPVVHVPPRTTRSRSYLGSCGPPPVSWSRRPAASSGSQVVVRRARGSGPVFPAGPHEYVTERETLASGTVVTRIRPVPLQQASKSDTELQEPQIGEGTRGPIANRTIEAEDL